jgi:UDP-N-acetyl-D-mannosaminuronate dehydrogenase
MSSQADSIEKAMKVGMIGLGKLGMPVALGISMKGHDVMGYGTVTQSF